MATMMDELFDANDDARKHAEDADRLRAVNAELLAAAKQLVSGYVESRGEIYGEDVRRMESAIARADGETKNRAG